jgi:hydrophobic/amphiphilic exporter-1 (mainly G- bacteria), HAE1 family
MKTLVGLCVRRPVFTWVIALSMIVLGAAGFVKMPVERFPNIEFAFVMVTVAAPGMSAEQVESEISTRIEGVLGSVSGLERLESISQEGSSLVMAQFVLSKNPDVAANEARDRVARLGDELPRAARPPRIETFNMNATPVVMVAVEADPPGARTPIELTEIADTLVRQELQTVRGVGEVKLAGGETRALSVELDPLRLRALDLTAQEVQRALERENLDVPGGSLPDGDNSLGVRLKAKASTADALAQVVVAKRDGLSVRIADLGRVIDGVVATNSRAYLSGHPGVLVNVSKQPGSNTVGVADEVRGRLTQLTPRLPDGVRVKVVQDNSEDVRAAVDAVTEHLIVGALLAALVVLLFLRSWRATLISALAIPTSVIGTFAAANALGMTLNLMSLLGLTLAVGIVIDDAIVVIENIVRTMSTKKLSPREAAVDATREIALAVLATTLSLVAVFLPVVTMEGIVGRYLAPFGLTMSVSILLSMAVAFTLTPMLSSRWLRKEDAHDHAADGVERRGRMERFYGGVLGWALRRRWVIGLSIVAMLVAIVPLAGALPATFVPIEDLSRLSVYVRLPERVGVERTAQVTEELAARIREQPDVSSTVSTTLNNREATIYVYLARPGLQDDMSQKLREQVSALAPPDALTMVTPLDDMAPPGPDSATVRYVIQGANLTELRGVAERMLTAAKQVPGTVDHGITTAGTKPEIALRVDRANASRLGVSHAEIGSALALIDREGVELGSTRDPYSQQDVSLKLRMRVASEELSPRDLVRALSVRSEQGQLVPLSDIAEMGSDEAPGVIRRIGRQRAITLFMNTLPGFSEVEVTETLNKKLEEIDPSGRYRGVAIGNAEEATKAANAFMVAIVLSFAFMFLILAAQFESWVHPLTILISLPLTIPFGLLALLLGGQTLNVFSALGFLVLFGVVKKNSILQVDRIIQLRAQGMERSDAVVHACLDRLRPILMTTLAFVAGMLPLVISSGAGAATNRAIAVGIMGGQTLSLALTLVATPIVYSAFDDSASWFRRRIAKWRARTSKVEAPRSA